MMLCLPDMAKARGRCSSSTEPWSRTTRTVSALRQSVLELWQLLCKERGRVWGQKTHALQTTYPNPEFLHNTTEEKGKSAYCLSTGCISLQPWLSDNAELSFLWKYLPLQPAPWLYPAICMPGPPSREARPNKRHGSRGEGLSWTRYALACSTCSAGCF